MKNPFVQLAKLLTGPILDDDHVELGKHPLDSEFEGYITFCGMYTEDYEDVISMAVKEMYLEDKIEFIFWLGNIEREDKQVWFEIRLANTCSYMSSGLTDYSGSYHDYKKLKDIVCLMVRNLPNSSVEYRRVPYQAMEVGWMYVNNKVYEEE
jgi:hypothetical protein